MAEISQKVHKNRMEALQKAQKFLKSENEAMKGSLEIFDYFKEKHEKYLKNL
jgi:hypothetical protein